MEDGTEESIAAAGDKLEGTEGQENENQKDTEVTEPGNEGVENVEGKRVKGEEIEREYVEGEQVEGEHDEGKHAAREEIEDEHIEGEHLEGEQAEGDEKLLDEGEELLGEDLEGEQVEGEETEQKEEAKVTEEEKIEEEQAYEEPPPDPTAPLDLSDSKEALKETFELRPDQLAEVEQLWDLYQNYTPAYTDIDGYITEKELFYMLKALLLMTYTPEQFQELIAYCVRPPHPEGHITYEQFLKMVKIRQRDFTVEDEIRSAFQVFDPARTGLVDREQLREVLAKQGHKMLQKHLDNFIKEVDIANDGTIGIEDALGTMCIDLNPEDLIMLKAAIFGAKEVVENEEEQF